MSTHSRLSPSKRSRWALCPGSIREESRFFDDESSTAAIDGTHSHTLLEFCIRNRVPATEYIGVKLCDKDGSFVVDIDRAGRVQLALDYINEKSLNRLLNVVAEVKVDPAFLLGRGDMFGALDCQIIGSDWIEIIDYKDGYDAVHAVGNMQLEQYAYGVLAGLMSTNVDLSFKTIILTIIQPRVASRGLDPITSWRCNVNELILNKGVIIEQASATDDPEAPLIPGESQCKYCKAKGSCLALAQTAMTEIGVVFHPVKDDPLNDTVSQLVSKDANALSDSDLCRIMESAPLVRQFIEAVEAEAFSRLRSGRSIPGLKLISGRGSRKWSLPDEEVAAKFTKMGVPKSVIYETKIVSPANAEKMKWVKKDGTVNRLSEGQLKIIENEYVTRTKGALKVALESDSSPAITLNTEHMFSAIASESPDAPCPVIL